jgi:hypothetical protein
MTADDRVFAAWLNADGRSPSDIKEETEAFFRKHGRRPMTNEKDEKDKPDYIEVELDVRANNIRNNNNNGNQPISHESLKQLCTKLWKLVAPKMERTYQLETGINYLIYLTGTNAILGKGKTVPSLVFEHGCAKIVRKLLDNPEKNGLIDIIKMSLCEPHVPKQRYVFGTIEGESAFIWETWCNDPDLATPEEKKSIAKYKADLIKLGHMTASGRSIIMKPAYVEDEIWRHLQAFQSYASDADADAEFERRMRSSMADVYSGAAEISDVDIEDHAISEHYSNTLFYSMNTAVSTVWKKSIEEEKRTYMFHPSGYRQRQKDLNAEFKFGSHYPTCFKSREPTSYRLQQELNTDLHQEQSSRANKVFKTQNIAREFGWKQIEQKNEDVDMLAEIVRMEQKKKEPEISIAKPKDIAKPAEKKKQEAIEEMTVAKPAEEKKDQEMPDAQLSGSFSSLPPTPPQQENKRKPPPPAEQQRKRKEPPSSTLPAIGHGVNIFTCLNKRQKTENSSSSKEPPSRSKLIVDDDNDDSDNKKTKSDEEEDSDDKDWEEGQAEYDQKFLGVSNTSVLKQAMQKYETMNGEFDQLPTSGSDQEGESEPDDDIVDFATLDDAVDSEEEQDIEDKLAKKEKRKPRKISSARKQKGSGYTEEEVEEVTSADLRAELLAAHAETEREIRESEKDAEELSDE